MSTRNIILFGDIGVGKSSIINLLFDQSIAPTSSGVIGCTFSPTSYDFNKFSTHFRVWDTPGIGIRTDGITVEAIVQLHRLLREVTGGVSLLVFCLHGSSRDPREEEMKMLGLVSDVLCDGRVPVVVAITGLEYEINMDDWWFAHNRAFQQFRTHVAGYACITSNQGKKMRSGNYMFDEEYADSREKLWTAIRSFVLCEPVYVRGWRGDVGMLVEKCGMLKSEGSVLASALASATN